MEKEIVNVIEKTVSATVAKLKMAGLMRDSDRTPADKTEQLLKNYNTFKESEQPYTKKIVRNIEKALESIESDEYGEIIKDLFFLEMSREEVAEEFGVDPSTISRNKKRLVDDLAAILFSDEVVLDLFS